MGKKTFLLINTYISGKFNKVYEGSSTLSAAKRAYTSLAENFKNSVKEFRFTLLEVDSNIKNDKLNFKNYKNYPSNKYYNFIVNEKLNNNNNKVKFKLARDNVELVNSNLLLKRINSIITFRFRKILIAEKSPSFKTGTEVTLIISTEKIIKQGEFVATPCMKIIVVTFFLSVLVFPRILFPTREPPDCAVHCTGW